MVLSRHRLWRATVSDTRRWVAILVSFALIWAIGLVVVALVLWVLGWFGVPIEPAWLVWLIVATPLVPFAVRARTPALVDGEQSWTEFAVRAVMVGENTTRPVWWRLASTYAFGPGLVGYAVVYGIQMVLGLV